MIKEIQQCNDPPITHGGPTKISSHVESLKEISKSEISSFRPFSVYNHIPIIWLTFIKVWVTHNPIYQFWPYILSFWLILQVLTIFFSLWGWASFWVFYLRSSDHHKPHQHVKLIWSHLPVSLKSTRLRGLCTSSLVCLCHGSVYCASICANVPACQKCASMPEGHPRSDWASLDVPWGSLRFLEVLDVLMAKTLSHCARWLKTHKTVFIAWFLLEMMIFVLFYLSCNGLLAVGTVKVCIVYVVYVSLVLSCTKFSLLTHIHLFIHESYSTW